MISVMVKEIALDQSMNPVVLLIDAQKSKVLPIWVGPFEARAIALGLEEATAPRPMTHDLMKNVFEELGAKIHKVVVNDIRDGTYYAEIYVEHAKRELVLDARPSDAIALALRSRAELYITEEVANYALDIEDVTDEEEKELLKRWLEGKPLGTDDRMLH